MRRRRFNALLAGAAGSAALGRLGARQSGGFRADIYANVGPRLLRYRIAGGGKSLVEVGNPIALPEEVQEACQWGRHFYVASSDVHTAASPRNHYLSAFEVDSSGTLEPIGDAVRLRHRPIHSTADPRGE